MLSENERSWTLTALLAAFAVAFAAAGLGLSSFAPGAAPAVASGLLFASLASTAGAFTTLAMRVRRLEAENVDLIEEVAEEFDRVKGRVDTLGDALAEPRSLVPEEAEQAATRRVEVK